MFKVELSLDQNSQCRVSQILQSHYFDKILLNYRSTQNVLLDIFSKILVRGVPVKIGKRTKGSVVKV